MSAMFCLLLMIFLHIVDDYYLQAKGCLALLKQKKYWEENEPAESYKYDYIWALIMHSCSWAFMIMLPLAIRSSFDIEKEFVIIYVINVVVHAITDDLKANKRQINLWQDQCIHILQICNTIMFLI